MASKTKYYDGEKELNGANDEEEELDDGHACGVGSTNISCSSERSAKMLALPGPGRRGDLLADETCSFWYKRNEEARIGGTVEII